MKVKIGTIARTVALFVTLVNQILTMTGCNPLPWSENEVYEGVSTLLMVAAAIVAWWKNNSFTPAALEADEVMKELKNS